MAQLRPSSFNAGPAWVPNKDAKLSSFGVRPFQKHRMELYWKERYQKPLTEALNDDQDEAEEPVTFEPLEAFKGPQPGKDGADVIVIHPGSTHVRVGLASSSIPSTVAQVVARRVKNPPTENAKPEKLEEDADFVSQVLQYAEDAENVIKTRMKAQKLRPVPNALQQVQSYNEASVPENIADHNDPYKIEWKDPNTLDAPVYGDQALLIPLEGSDIKLFFPFANGELNTITYTSREQLSVDLHGCWSHAIEKELDITADHSSEYSVVLIIPDIFERDDVLLMIDVLVYRMGFKSFSVQQESACAAYGAGISYACVVDVGAQKTSIACVEEGLVIPESRLNLKFGGDDITRVFNYLLKARTEFPYRELNIYRLYDFFTVEALKEHYCTLHEGDIAVQHYDCYIRAPNTPTLLYKFKIFDEAMAAPIAPYFPAEFMFKSRTVSYLDRKKIVGVSEDSYKVTKHRYWKSCLGIHIPEGEQTPVQKSASKKRKPVFTNGYIEVVPVEPVETNLAPGPEETPSATPNIPEQAVTDESTLPLDNAIVMSIASTSPKMMESFKSGGKDKPEGEEPASPTKMTSQEEDRIRRLYASILLVGGGLALFPGSSKYLQDHLRNAFHYLLPDFFGHNANNSPFKIDYIQVLANPRDIDPQYMCWKGGAVSSRLESLMRDCWISSLEWELVGPRLLPERMIFKW